MSAQHARRFSRRRFLGIRAKPVAAEPPPETTRLRLYEWPAICFAPHYVAKALLQGEGFTDVQYINVLLTQMGDY